MEAAIDLGKRRSYVVLKERGKVLKEDYVDTDKEAFEEFFGGNKDVKLVVEASCTLNKIANMFEGYDITVAHPYKVRLIAQSVRKTDKIDAHVLMDLYEKDYLPKAYLPDRRIREMRDLCRNRMLFVRQRTASKNSIRYHADCLSIDIAGFDRKTIAMLSGIESIRPLIDQLKNLDKTIKGYDDKIAEEVAKDHNAGIIDTVPGIGKVSALVISSEIGDVSRFSDAERLFSYAGLAPSIRQSGDTERKGHITKGNVYLKTVLVECVQVHILHCKDSFITRAYHRIRVRAGNKKAKIAAARKLLQLIYLMLRRNETYHGR